MLASDGGMVGSATVWKARRILRSGCLDDVYQESDYFFRGDGRGRLASQIAEIIESAINETRPNSLALARLNKWL